MSERELSELEDDELIETEELDEPEEDGEKPETEGEESDETLDDELVVTIGDEPPEEEDRADTPQWVKDTREENRKLKKQLKALQTQSGGATQRKALAAKPKLADFEYDEAKHEAALDAWYEAKRDADKAERDAADSQTQQQREWDSRLQGHVKAKGALKVKGYDEAEEAVFEVLDATQQGILISGAENSALVVWTLKQYPKQLKELAAIKDPVKYAFAIAKLETKLKTTKRRPATPPETSVARSNTGGVRTNSAALEKLRAEAEKSGDYSKVHAYRQKLRTAK